MSYASAECRTPVLRRAVGDFNVRPYHLRAVQGLEGLHTAQPMVLQVVSIFLRGKCNKHTRYVSFFYFEERWFHLVRCIKMTTVKSGQVKTQAC